MSTIILLDTTVYLNVLDIPGRNQERSSVLASFEQQVKGDAYFLLPMATIFETGSHIARLPGGGNRYRCATILVEDVTKAVKGEAPYTPTSFPEREHFLTYLSEFPEYAKRSKSPARDNEGISLADLSIIKEWERACGLHPGRRVRIWSLDQDLSSYDRPSSLTTKAK